MSTLAVGAGALVLVTAILLDASVAAAQGWQLVEPMPTARAYHAAATVGDRWYVAGGLASLGTGSGERFPDQVDVYDPNSGHWTVLGQLEQGRDLLLAIPDPSRSRVLFTGGFLPAGANAYLPLATCDVAGPDVVASAPSLLGARHLHAVALAAGKFVVTGGGGLRTTGDNLLDDAEVWDGTSPTWMPAGRMPSGRRSGHTMTTLRNGRQILVVGGSTSTQPLRGTDLFDALCGSWSAAPSLAVARGRHEAVLLTDGRVLVAGGSWFVVESSAELFDPTTAEWKPAASMHDARFDFDMVLLPDGRVLVAGGSNNSAEGAYGALSSAEVYDPVANTWTILPPMNDRRRWPTLAVLSDGVYVAGGTFSLSTFPGSATVLSSVERLPWSELGISGPVNVDAGLPDEIPPDASTVCPSEDAGVGGDAALDAGELADGGSDASQPDVSTDTPVGDAGAGGGKSGCSCNAGEVRDNWLTGLALAFVVFCPALRRRSRRH